MTDDTREPRPGAAGMALPIDESRSRALAANLPAAVFRYVLSPDGTDCIEFLGAGCREILEVEMAPGAQEGATALWAAIVPDDVSGVRASLELSARTRTCWSHRWRIQPPSGRARWLHGSGAPRGLPNGDIEWHGVLLDVTDGARVEETLARTLREHQATTDNLLLADSAGRLLWWNRRVREALGGDPAELCGREVVACFADEDRAIVAAALARAAVDGYCEFEARLLVRGEPVYFQYAAVALQDEGGHLVGVAASGRDGSERHRIEAALRTLNEELERRTADLAAATLAAERISDSKSEFMSRLSHELRTPMSAVLGFTQLLLAGKGGPLGDVQRDYLAKVKRASEHVLELLNEVLDLAQVEAGRIDIDCKPVRLKQLVGEAMELTQPLAEARGVTLAVSADASPPVRVSADARRLRQVLLNLLSNAIKYNFTGGRVTIGWVIDHGHALISVTDTGPGIAPVLQLKLFQPFERLYPEHGAEGTGLGLTISRRLVDLMGGQIGVTSRTGEGSTFWVRLTALPDL